MSACGSVRTCALHVHDSCVCITGASVCESNPIKFCSQPSPVSTKHFFSFQYWETPIRIY